MGQLIKNGINYTGGTGIIDNVGSTSPSLALSANQGKMLANDMGAVEIGDSALNSYSVGQYFIWKSQFVKVITAISAGDTIIATGNNANVTPTNIGSVLTELNTNFKHIQYLGFSKAICANDLDNNGIYTVQTNYRPRYSTRLNIACPNAQLSAICTIHTNGILEYAYAKISNSSWQDLFPNEPVIYLNSLKGTRSASDTFFWADVFGWFEI